MARRKQLRLKMNVIKGAWVHKKYAAQALLYANSVEKEYVLRGLTINTMKIVGFGEIRLSRV